MTQMLERVGGDTLALIDETLTAAGLTTPEAGLPVDGQTAEAVGSVAVGEYSYTVTYDKDGAVAGGRSVAYDPETATKTELGFDEKGNVVDSHTWAPGYEAQYVGGVRRFTHTVEDEAGDFTVSRWFDEKGNLSRSTLVNKADNTLTMQFVQNGTYGPVEIVTPYAGADGWVSSAPKNIAQEKIEKKD